MNKKKILSLLTMILVVVSLSVSSSALAKSEPQVLNFVGYTCVKSWGDVQFIVHDDGSYTVQIRGMINEPVIYQVTDKGRKLYAIASKFLNLDVTYALDNSLISSVGAGYNNLKLVNGNGGWEGPSFINFFPGQNDNLSEQGVLTGTGSLKGKVMTLKAYGGYTGEIPSDGVQVCEGHGDYLDFGPFTGTIDAKKNK